MTPHTSRWDAQGEPMPKGEGVVAKREAKEKKEPLSFRTSLSLLSI